MTTQSNNRWLWYCSGLPSSYLMFISTMRFHFYRQILLDNAKNVIQLDKQGYEPLTINLQNDPLIQRPPLTVEGVSPLSKVGCAKGEVARSKQEFSVYGIRSMQIFILTQQVMVYFRMGQTFNVLFQGFVGPNNLPKKEGSEKAYSGIYSVCYFPILPPKNILL